MLGLTDEVEFLTLDVKNSTLILKVLTLETEISTSGVKILTLEVKCFVKKTRDFIFRVKRSTSNIKCLHRHLKI